MKSPIYETVELLRRALGELKPIQLSGYDISTDHRTVRRYYWIGFAYIFGANSLRDTSRFLTSLEIANRYPLDLPAGETSIREAALKARVYFGKHFDLSCQADLFVMRGLRDSFQTLTHRGLVAWVVTEAFIMRQESDLLTVEKFDADSRLNSFSSHSHDFLPKMAQFSERPSQAN